MWDLKTCKFKMDLLMKSIVYILIRSRVEAEIGQLKYKWGLFLCTGMMKLTVLCVDGKIEPRVTNSELLLPAECY